MKLQLFSVYDTIADIFNKPFAAHNDKDAMRAFVQSFTRGEQANKNDYVLYRVANWDDSNGDIESYPPFKVITGFDIKEDEAA